MIRKKRMSGKSGSWRRAVGLYLFLCPFVFLCAADPQESGGFRVELDKSGKWKSISFRDRVLLRNFVMTGNCIHPSGKGFVRLESIREKSVVSREMRNGRLHLVVEAPLGSEAIPDAAQSRMEVEFDRETITVSARVETRKTLSTRYRLFFCRGNLEMALISGRGMLTIGSDGKRILQLIPEHEAIRKNCAGAKLAFSLNSEETLLFESLSNSMISLQDARIWGGRVGTVEMAHVPQYSSTPIAYPPGSVFEWRFRIRLMTRRDDPHLRDLGISARGKAGEAGSEISKNTGLFRKKFAF